MTTQESKQQYEGAILNNSIGYGEDTSPPLSFNQLIKNSERLVIVERDIAEIEVDIAEIFGEIKQELKAIIHSF